MKNKINPPIIYQSFILIMCITFFLPLNNYISFPYNLAGLPLFLLGYYLAAKPKKIFLETNTAIDPNAKPTKLHTSGIFSITRNPMYLGIVIGLLGIAILTGWIFNLFFPVAYFFIMNNYFIKNEEKKLEKEFGNEYFSYKTKTRRWL